ncbi:WYL domain-containing protein [Naasia aerilata]|uniref:WYL domain-containing protein n=1 Tax=Naasia aerilata TaxID=1162966 RepID=A0ABN6XQL2_9MICO|nr:WYL domain-containing protein [Naasia aerilata]BDZ47277.1 hypothetical protein GCM10025866_31860 [Naasia aerilata]
MEPLALVKHEGRWHLASQDRARKAPRTFLLSRIVGPVTTTRTVFVPPEGDAAAAALNELDRILANGRVRIRVAPGSDAETRLSRRAASVPAEGSSCSTTPTPT